MHPLFSLQQLREHNGIEWGFPMSDHTEERGYLAVKDSILRYLAWMERVELIRERTGRAVGNASMFSFDSMGGAFKYGIDADSGQLARTEILDDGSRRPFGVRLRDKGRHALRGLSEVAPWVKRSKQDALIDDVRVDEEATKTSGTMTCSVCNWSQTFRRGNRQEFTMARSRMAQHLKRAKVEQARHRLLYQKKFESPTART